MLLGPTLAAKRRPSDLWMWDQPATPCGRRTATRST